MAFSFTDSTPTVGQAEFSITTSSTAAVAAQTTKGIYALWVDLNALVAGDQYRLRTYEKVGATQRIIDERYFDGPQSDPGISTPALILGTGWDFTLQRTSTATSTGLDKVLPCSVRGVI